MRIQLLQLVYRKNMSIVLNINLHIIVLDTESIFTDEKKFGLLLDRKSLQGHM